MSDADIRTTGNKHVLCLMYHFPPMGGIPVMRSLRIARYLSNHGWNPVIVTCDGGFDAIHGTDRALLSEIPRHVPVISISDPLGRVLARLASVLKVSLWRQIDRMSKVMFFPDERIVWAAIVFWRVRRAVKAGEKIAAIYATGYPWSSFLLGAFLKHVYQRPLILDFRDAWTLNPSPLWRRFKLHGLLEKALLKRADRVIFVTESMKGDYQAKYPAFAAKMAAIYNGFDREHFFQQETIPTSKPDHKEVEELTLCYTGSLSDTVPAKSHSQSLAPFLQACSNLRTVAPELYGRLRIEVFSNDVPNTRKFARRLGVDDKVRFHSRVSHAEIPRILAGANCLMLIVMRGPVAKQMAPAKIYEYIASGKPILAISPGYSEAARLVEMYELGIVVDYHDLSNSLASALNSLFFEEKWKERNGRFLEAQRIFDGERLVGELAGLLDEVTEPLTDSVKRSVC